LQTVLASKGTRVVEAAAGRPVVDFSLRRSHGVDAGLKAARAFYVAGVASTLPAASVARTLNVYEPLAVVVYACGEVQAA